MSDKSLTTTNIGIDELKHLKKLAAHHKLKQVEFINASISYFKKTGINPAEEIYSPREKIEILSKRVQEVIKFMQVHEKQRLVPLLEHLILLERRLSETYSKVITKDDLIPLGNLTIKLGKELDQILANMNSDISIITESQKHNFNALYQNQMQTITLIGLLYEFMKNKSMAGFREDDKKRFEDAISKIR